MKKEKDISMVVGNQDSSQEHEVRIEKVKKLQAQNIQAWPTNQPINGTAAEVLFEFKEDQESPLYEVAGRIMSIRLHGKTGFAHIQDRTGKLQVYIRKDNVGETAFDFFKQFIDIGDSVLFEGRSFKTKMGEISLKVEKFTLLSKCLHPLPEKFHGLSDVETIYRQRYLDLIANVESKDRFLKRSKIINQMRFYLDNHGFVEVETPLLHPIPGGATARPFITHHNVLDMDLYLRIAPELYLKRLVIGGLERVYEIGRCFRNEGLSTRHNPEFTILEFYMAYQDYTFGMDMVEEMLRKIAETVNGTTEFSFGELTLDFGKPFERLTMHDAVKKYANLSDEDLSEKNIAKTIAKKGLEVQKDASVGAQLYYLFEELVESNIEQPTFIIGFPIEVSPLAKRDSKNHSLAARFELFMAGMEISNGYNELNDPFDQAERFRQQAKLKDTGDKEAQHYDADYVKALEYGLPPTVGVGIGVDRLAMLLTNATSIRDVILFPVLKKKD